MTLTIKTTFIAYGAGVAAIVIGTIAAMVTYWVPNLISHRTTISENQAAIAAIERQQQNLNGIAEQISARQADQAVLDAYVWPFSDELDFFDLWDTIAVATATDISLDTISEATPGDAPIRRDATLTITGTMANVWQAVSRLTTVKPILAIQSYQLTPGDQAPAVTARVVLATLWYDDSIR